MKLPSIHQVAQGFVATFRRFPFPICIALVGTVIALVLADRTEPEQPTVLFKILLASGIGLPFSIGLTLVAEKRRWRAAASWGAFAVGIVLLVGYALTVPASPFRGPEMHMARFSLLLVFSGMFMTAAPFVRKGELNGFWQYNKSLVFRLLITGIYCGVLFAGLAIALTALDTLFGVNVPPKRYFELWIAIVGFFGTTFFLAGIPDELATLDSVTEYPKGLKVFAQYILLPLVLVYLIILYAYIGKIAVQWNWPKGMVSGLILGFSVTGILAFLLVYPIRDLAGNRWMQKAWRWFYLVIIPLIVVLFLAASQRVSQYGITEGRYILFVCGCWLTLITLYFNLSRGKSIKVIPISVGIISLAISFGPWGAFAVSERSQVGRLTEILTRNEILSDGKVRKAPAAVNAEDSREISSIILYLRNFHGYDRIQPWFATNLTPDSAGAFSPRLSAEDVTKLMGVEFTWNWPIGNREWTQFHVRPQSPIDTRGYEYIVHDQSLPGQGWFGSDSATGIGIGSNTGLDTVTVYTKRDGITQDSIRLDVREFLDSLRTKVATGWKTDLPPDSLSLTAETPGLRVKLLVENATVWQKKDSLATRTCTVDILYSLKPPEK